PFAQAGGEFDLLAAAAKFLGEDRLGERALADDQIARERANADARVFEPEIRDPVVTAAPVGAPVRGTVGAGEKRDLLRKSIQAFESRANQVQAIRRKLNVLVEKIDPAPASRGVTLVARRVAR